MLFQTLFSIAWLSMFGLLPSEAKVVGIGRAHQIKEGVFHYYYDDSITFPCETIVFIGVGTAMGSNDYGNLSHDIVSGESVVAVIIDHNPKRIQKQNPRKYADLVNAIVNHSNELIPVCNDRPGGIDPAYIVGGHSAGGQGAIEALPLLSFDPIGFVGLAPYRVPEDRDITVPALFWGFSRTSCSVCKDGAAKLGYEISNASHRVFYQVQTDNRNTVTGGPHCVFTDRGCPGWWWIPFQFCGGTSAEVEWIPPAVGKSINVFIKAVDSLDGFRKESFEENILKGTKLFFNDEEVETKAKSFVTA